MRQRIWARPTDISVSELGLGGFFLSRWGTNFEDCRRAVHLALDRGVNYLDTAPAYADSEEVIGRILREIRTPLIVSTKLGGRPAPFNPHSKSRVRESVQESLRLLGRDVIDILFVHEPDRPKQYAWWTDPENIVGPVLEVLDELKRAGIIRYSGIGGTTTTEMAHFVRSGKFDVVLTAFNYSALFREAEQEIFPQPAKTKWGLSSVLRCSKERSRFGAMASFAQAGLARAEPARAVSRPVSPARRSRDADRGAQSALCHLESGSSCRSERCENARSRWRIRSTRLRRGLCHPNCSRDSIPSRQWCLAGPSRSP